MKTKVLFIIAWTVLNTATIYASGKFKLEDFSMNLEQANTLPQHVWVSSGYTTVSPTHRTATGVGEFYSPPFIAKALSMTVDILADSSRIFENGEMYNSNLHYTGGVWMPHKIVRRAIFHHTINGKLVSLQVTTELIPLFGQVGFIEKITCKNNAPTSVSLKILPDLNTGTPGLSANTYRPWSVIPPVRKVPAQPSGPGRWSNDDINLGLYVNNESRTLQPGESLTTTITVMMVKNDEKLPEKIDEEALIKTTTETWQKRIETYTKNIPTLASNIDGLDDYYKRSILSGLICIWENPAYVTNPFVTTSGMDGGGFCTYIWDNAGYVPNMITLMLDDKVKDMARQMEKIDLEKHLSFSIDGSGLGLKYSYSVVSFARLVDAIFKHLGPDKALFEYLRKVVLNDEKRKADNNLIDYGLQANLLEMFGDGWEHFVVSPNSERSWCLNRLAEMGQYTGETPAVMNDWKQQGDRIIEAVRKELWDNDKQWFASLYPDGSKEYVHSIQVFDAMWVGACTPEMEKILVSELNDNGYLGICGVASVSKSDTLHYDALDTDWSGGGAYVGDGPQTALIMYEKCYPELGWDILRRHFWMGKHSLYYPQEIHCDRPSESEVLSRANIIAGLTAAEAILYGLTGFQPQYDGTLYIHPQVTVPGTINIKGFVYRNNTFDVEVSASKVAVSRNGKTIYKGKPKRVKIL